MPLRRSLDLYWDGDAIYMPAPRAGSGKRKTEKMVEGGIIRGVEKFRPGGFQRLLTSSPTLIDGGLGARGKPVEGLERNGG